MAKGNTLKLDLLENAINSIVHGLEHYADGKKNTSNYKFAILHIAQGVELMLKERLHREHWVLIYDYDKVGKPNKSRTIDFEKAVARLRSICNVNLDKYIDGLRTLRKARHEIEHYKVSLSEQEATAIIGSNIPFLMEFLEDELKTTLQEHVKEEETWQELLGIEYVFAKAIGKANKEMAWVYKEGDQEYPMGVECPACGLEYLVIKGKNDKEAECLLCKHVSELKECLRCYKLFPADDWSAEGGLCADCTTYLKEPYT